MTVEESEADKVRVELVVQLRESLARSRQMMLNEKLDPKTCEKWTQVNANTAQVLNQVLRDMQFKDWEKRLKEMEARRRQLQASIGRLEKGSIVPTSQIGERPTSQEDTVPKGGS